MLSQISPAYLLDRFYSCFETEENTMMLYAAFFAASASIAFAANRCIRSKCRVLQAQSSAPLERIHDHCIWVICQVGGGNGDLMQALTVFHLIDREIKEKKAPVDLKFVPLGDSAKRLFDEFRRAKNPLVPNERHLVGCAPCETNYPENLVVQLPINENHPLSLNPVTGSINTRFFKKIFINEYSSERTWNNKLEPLIKDPDWQVEYAGCGKGLMGVFSAPDEKYKAALQRGVEQNNDLLEALLKSPEIGLQEFGLTESQFYFGYVHAWSTARLFLGMLSRLNGTTDQDITLVLAGNLLPRNLDEGRALLRNMKYGEFLVEHNIKKIEIISVHEPVTKFWFKQKKQYTTTTFPLKDPGNNKKTLRLVLPGHIPEEMTLDFHIAAQPITITTGDKSLTNALTLGIPTVYECLPHKSNAIQALAKQLEFDVGAFLLRTQLEPYAYLSYENSSEKFSSEMSKGNDEKRLVQFRRAAETLRIKHSYPKKLLKELESFITPQQLA